MTPDPLHQQAEALAKRIAERAVLDWLRASAGQNTTDREMLVDLVLRLSVSIDAALQRVQAETREEKMNEVETIRVVNKLVDGYDAQFWHDSYLLLREAITTHLDDCIRDDDVAEEAILVEAIETAGKRLRGPERIACDE